MSDADPDQAPGPRHVAIIMDGNGRWAERRGLPRAVGHREGVQALKRTVQAAPRLGVECLTVYGFSTENWRRSAEEVSDLMGLVRAYVGSDLARLKREGVRVRILGRREGLPPDIADIVARTEAETAANDRFRLQVAFNYGGRADVVDAARKLAAAGEAIDEESFGRALSTGDGPPVDVIVRTSGETRLSNFLLWEAAYAELVFQDVLWPDYGEAHLAEVVAAFRNRDRRYGGRPAVSA
ncbi:MAG TPA: polyprenyl diphosphate synthase [Brevundimonas sp.]|jgi:undecaprenyl diphosphate synthase|uniref:polyprenyl diphosphate synthase n=1 Tax=Brevundimonas sp. TaxID=1871086 RepID=UPI002DEB700E|nr:polyprenyl diphosphate synthase [Brevundimonas sp.]